MRGKYTLFSLCMVAAIFVLTASTGWAAANCFVTGKYTTGTDTTKVAVAANFVAAATQLIYNCQDTGTCGTNTKYTICSDSTGNLMGNELADDYDGGFQEFGYFFAADESAQTYNSGGIYAGTGTAYVYATGIPVFIAMSSTYNNVSYLLTGQSGGSLTIPDEDLSSLAINTTDASKVAVANSSAPYGLAAYDIINSIEGFTSPQLPNFTPDWLHYCGNIGDTFNHVTNGWDGVKSGFVAKSQICNSTSGQPYNDTYIWVEFTNDAYLLTQKAIKLNSSTAATALDNYIITTLGATTSGSGWRNFIKKWCYKWPDP